MPLVFFFFTSDGTSPSWFPRRLLRFCIFATSLGDHKIHYSSVKRKDLTTSVGFVTDIHQKQRFSGKKAAVSSSPTPR